MVRFLTFVTLKFLIFYFEILKECVELLTKSYLL